MKLTINSKELLRALLTVNKSIKNRNSLPILTGIAIKVEDGVVTFTGGDGEVFITTQLECDLLENGSCVVESKPFINGIKSLPNTGIEIEVTDKLVCDYNSGKFELGIYSYEEYPSFEKPNGEPILIEDTKAINTASRYVADDELRPVMNGIYFDFTKGYVVSSDGHKLYKSEKVLPNGQEAVILPIQGYNAIKDMASFEMCFDERNILFKSDNTEVIARLIDGRYPNYDSVIPSNDKVFEVDREALLGALKRVNVMADETTSLVKMEFSREQLMISTQDLDFSTSASESLTCVGSEEVTIGYKGTFLEQILNGVTGDIVRFEISEPSRATIIRGDTEEIFLLMPMML